MYTYVCMHVCPSKMFWQLCRNVCICTRMHVCMCVCENVSTPLPCEVVSIMNKFEFLYVCMPVTYILETVHTCMHASIHRHMCVCMITVLYIYECMYVCMSQGCNSRYVCMYVCVYIWHVLLKSAHMPGDFCTCIDKSEVLKSWQSSMDKTTYKTYIQTHTHLKSRWPCWCTRIHACKHVCIHTYTHTHTHIPQL